jgi:hypothetical protein
VNKELAYRKISLGKYLDIVKIKWFNETKEREPVSKKWTGYTVITQC